MKALQDLQLFVHTAGSGSLSASARVLDITPAAASAALKRLEAELGVQLFVRSTRSLRLTPQGEGFLAQCRPALAQLQQAAEQLAADGGALRGVLRLAAPSDFGRNLLLGWLDEFQGLHPQVGLRLQLSDRHANIYGEPVDAALRYGQPKDSSLVALPLAPWNRRVLCAAPAYLAQHGSPATPAELAGHACLCYQLGEEVHDRWHFPAGEGRPALVQRVPVRNAANDAELVQRWALAGRGVAYKSRLDVAAHLASGRLVALCPQWQTEPTPLYMVLPDRRQLSPLLRALQAFLLERLEALRPAAPAALV